MRWALIALVVLTIWFLDGLVHDSCDSRCYRIFGTPGVVEHQILNDLCFCVLPEGDRIQILEARHGR